jgi:hypothetical protein
VKLGLEDKKKATWAIALGAVALLAVAYEVLPMFMDSSTPSSSAQAAAPAPRVTARPGTKGAKKPRAENLDPTLRLDLLATIEQTQYRGSGRNIFVSQAEQVKIPEPKAPAETEEAKSGGYTPPPVPQPPPIPLKFYGFASRAGEPKRIFLSLDQDVFVAGEGEIVNRRYKVIHISPNSVEIQDMVYSGPPQTLPLSQG